MLRGVPPPQFLEFLKFFSLKMSQNATNLKFTRYSVFVIRYLTSLFVFHSLFARAAFPFLALPSLNWMRKTRKITDKDRNVMFYPNLVHLDTSVVKNQRLRYSRKGKVPNSSLFVIHFLLRF